jgi:hypothetical protein
LRDDTPSPFASSSQSAEDSRSARRSSTARVALGLALSGVMVLTTAAAASHGTLAASYSDPGRLAMLAPVRVSTPSDTQVTATSTGRCSVRRKSAPDGWRRVMSDAFHEDIPRGEWGRTGGPWENPGGKWRARQAGSNDTSGRGTYSSPKTTSQHHGLLDVWIHSEGSTRYIAAPIPLVGDKKGQRVSLCMRANEIPGYKIAFMLWPKEGPGNYHGEIDYPETKLLRSVRANAFMHFDPKPRSGKTQDWYDTGVRLQGWHVFTMKWRPSRDYVSFFVDGRRVGRSHGPEVPNGPMHYIMQMETYVSGPLPAPAAGHVKVDWFTIDVPA